jgi:outer membrane protein assembly factor BamB
MDGTRWIAVPALGPPHAELKAPVTNGAISNGFIVAFKLRAEGGKTRLEPTWISRDLASPLPPVIVNGVVFVVSAGEFTRQITKSSGDLTTIDEKPKGSTHATLYALDAKTGRELYSSRDLVSVPASLTGITVANGRVYFGGVDGSFYAFGKYMEH